MRLRFGQSLLFALLMLISSSSVFFDQAHAIDSQILISSPKVFEQIDRNKPVIIDAAWINWPTANFCLSWGNRVGVKVYGAPADYKGYDYNYGWLRYSKVDLGIDRGLKSYWVSPSPGPEGGYYDFAVMLDGDYKAESFHISIDTRGWAPGSYPVVVSGISYSNDCGNTQTDSMTIVIPPLNTPKVNCTINETIQIRQGDMLAAVCNSSSSFSNIELNLQINTTGKWIDTGLKVLANGTQFTVKNLPTNLIGGNSVRLSSDGIPDQLAAFSSQVLSYKVMKPLEIIDFALGVSKFAMAGNSELVVSWKNSLNLNGERFQVLTSSFPGGPWDEYKTGNFNGNWVDVAVKKPKGTWIKIVFGGNSEYAASESNIVQLLEAPIIKCTLPTSGKVGIKVAGSCTSNTKLARTPILFELDSGDGWEENGSGEYEGLKTTFSFTPGSSGTLKLRIFSEGLIDNYSSFVSNVMTIKIPEPAPVQAPKGKVDKLSNAYKTMKTVGGNFAKVSLASDSAYSQCISALRTGLIKNNGRPFYLGIQARMIQSYLSTPSGFQGCLDGFGR